MTIAYQLKQLRVVHQQQCVLDISSLNLKAGQCIAILGDNGAGKSTLLNLLSFVESPSHGSIQFFDQATSLPLSPEQRKKIGYVSQHPFLLSGTIRDNIYLALSLQNIDKTHFQHLTEQALACVNLTHLAEQDANTLSGGELKRAAIARAICYQPDVLLLDEPFSHLDQNHCQQLETIISQLAQHPNRTVIFSTHNRLQGMALADSTINLVKGKTTKTPLLNLFDGQLNDKLFDTGNISIHTTSTDPTVRHIAIDPHQIIISHDIISSSMQNNYLGRLTAISEEANSIRLTIDCGERFHAIISPESLIKLELFLGCDVWISFKSNAVSVF